MRRLLLALLPLWGCAAPTLVDADLVALTALANEVDGDSLMATVTAFSNAHLADTPIDCAQLGNVTERFCHLTRETSRDLMRSRFEALGYTVTTQVTEDGLLSTTNLIAEKTGTTRPDEIILIGAHFDAFYGGADDNSSGVAAVLELARLFSTRSFDRTVRFVGFDLEEMGLVGSTRYVGSVASNEPIVASIAFDCIGFTHPTQSSLPGLPSPKEGNFLAVIANGLSEPRAQQTRLLNDALGGLVPLVGIIAPADGASPIAGNLMRSDHAPFWLAGREALFFTDTANFRNPNYHQQSDLPETLDPEFLRSNVRLAAATAAYFAGGPR
ncbi:MAG: M28 family peptidase [Myxococcota bacterium]|nr:M28 family peptidase [Myxococcota bacterium]